MKWQNLLTNKCPKCPYKLHKLLSGKLIMCNSKKCNFKISPNRMEEIIAGLKQPSWIDNQEELNNLEQKHE